MSAIFVSGIGGDPIIFVVVAIILFIVIIVVSVTASKKKKPVPDAVTGGTSPTTTTTTTQVSLAKFGSIYYSDNHQNMLGLGVVATPSIQSSSLTKNPFTHEMALLMNPIADATITRSSDAINLNPNNVNFDGFPFNAQSAFDLGSFGSMEISSDMKKKMVHYENESSLELQDHVQTQSLMLSQSTLFTNGFQIVTDELILNDSSGLVFGNKLYFGALEMDNTKDTKQREDAESKQNKGDALFQIPSASASSSGTGTLEIVYGVQNMTPAEIQEITQCIKDPMLKTMDVIRARHVLTRGLNNSIKKHPKRHFVLVTKTPLKDLVRLKIQGEGRAFVIN